MRMTSQGRVATTQYRGRFAPTPSGPLHLGSLFTALAGWLDARAQHGSWLIRLDDLDQARCVRGGGDIILRQLEQHGLHWDEAPRYQSQHRAEYQAALLRLRQAGHLYPCSCTRAELQAESLTGPDDAVYAGHCRQHPRNRSRAMALRFRVPARSLILQDDWQGDQRRDVIRDIGDFILQRSDGVIGYQLACVIDEQAQDITHVVRGSDLLGSSFRQRLLQDALEWEAPRYRHLPVLGDASGRKFSKQNHAQAITPVQATRNLWRCLDLLDQAPPASLKSETPSALLQWAIEHWRPELIARAQYRAVEE